MDGVRVCDLCRSYDIWNIQIGIAAWSRDMRKRLNRALREKARKLEVAVKHRTEELSQEKARTSK